MSYFGRMLHNRERQPGFIDTLRSAKNAVLLSVLLSVLATPAQARTEYQDNEPVPVTTSSETTSEQFQPDDSVEEQYSSQLNFVTAGTIVDIPDSILIRVDVPYQMQTVELDQKSLELVDQVVETVYPDLGTVFDEVMVFPHPNQEVIESGDSITRTIMVGVTSVDTIDNSMELSLGNHKLRMFLFLPNEIISGTGIDTPVDHFNLVPYADAPTPSTLGEIFQWIVLHEGWHGYDLKRRIAIACSEFPEGDCQILSQMFTDVEVLASFYRSQRVSELLGIEDSGTAYFYSDELDQRGVDVPRSVGYTTYIKKFGGAFQVEYDDGDYQFSAGYTRLGHVPSVLLLQEDLSTELMKGYWPTLYALFTPDMERYAEFATWFLFNKIQGQEELFREVFPELAEFFTIEVQELVEYMRQYYPLINVS